MKIAVPSDTPGGLDAKISGHFGHCDAFTLVDVTDNEVGEVEIHQNGGHEHGGCMAPVMTLKELDVDALLAGGMGMRPLTGFQQVGIDVFFKEDAGTVREAIDLFVAGKLKAFGESETCGGGGGECGGHHHHAEVVREPIEGKADVRNGRVVTMDFALKDPDGKVLDSSASDGPMRYLQGSGAIEGIEKAIDGLEAGAELTVKLGPGEAFGDRDEAKVMEVPRDQLPPQIEKGMMLMAQSPDGHQIPLIVIEIKEDVARLDANHPLAGQATTFELKITAVENATDQERQHGHVH